MKKAPRWDRGAAEVNATTPARQIACAAAPRQDDLDLIVDRLSHCADDVARSLLGPPTNDNKPSRRRELRYGRHGSVRVCIAGLKRGRWNDFERGERGDLLDLIRREQGCSFGEACDYARELLGIRRSDARPKATRPRPAPKHKPKPEDDADRVRYALQIWRETESIIGTPGAAYLDKRGIDLDAVPDLDSVLRGHSRCPWGEGGARHPCLIALWTDVHSIEPRAIHRRPISACRFRKPPPSDSQSRANQNMMAV